MGCSNGPFLKSHDLKDTNEYKYCLLKMAPTLGTHYCDVMVEEHHADWLKHGEDMGYNKVATETEFYCVKQCPVHYSYPVSVDEACENKCFDAFNEHKDDVPSAMYPK